MNFYTLIITRDGQDEITKSSNKLELITLARMAYPANARVTDVNGMNVFIQTADHTQERD